jgi:hypothetical protein
MLRDETRGLLQEAHSIRRNESPAPLGLLFSIANSKHARAISISPACWHDASSCSAERPLSGSPAVARRKRILEKVDSGPLGGPDGDDSQSSPSDSVRLRVDQWLRLSTEPGTAGSTTRQSPRRFLRHAVRARSDES